jgi:hypothetical protein
MAEKANYQAGIIAVQLFLQQEVTKEKHVSSDAILQFYLRKSQESEVDFLEYRAVRFFHEDDERDGTEDESPLTCARAQDVFEHVERYLRTKHGPDNTKASEQFDPAVFLAMVDKQYAVILNAFDAAVKAVVVELFHKNESRKQSEIETNDVMRTVAQYIVRASVLSTDDFFERFSDEERVGAADTFKIEMNEKCEIVRVVFEAFDDLDTTLLFQDPDVFTDRYIVMKTDSDSRLRTFYKSAAEYINETIEIYLDLEKRGLIKRPRI